MQWTVFLVQRSVAVKLVNMMSKSSQIRNYKHTANISSGALRGQTRHFDPRQLLFILTVERALHRHRPQTQPHFNAIVQLENVLYFKEDKRRQKTGRR